MEKNTKTYQNIEESLVNEAKAIICYLVYADIALAEGNQEAADFFKKMAKNEMEHAKTWFKYTHDISGDTITNLNKAANNENEEWKTSYPEAAMQAKEEGFDDVAAMFERISSIECDHERRFVEMILIQEEAKQEEAKQEEKESTEEGKKQQFCIFCGFPAREAMEICPVCGASDSFVAE